MSELAATYGVNTGGGAALPRLSPARSWLRCETPTHGQAFPASCGCGVAEQRAHFRETLLHAAWRRLSVGSGIIRGRDGHGYRVVYPGRPADGAGPDFRDAVLLRDDGTQVHGDIEVHVRSGDWHSHGHGTDRAYNGVVLHVAMTESGSPVETTSGLRIPLLLLGRNRVFENTGTRQPETTPVPLPFLDMAAAGDEWFRNRSHGCALEIAAKGADQALWDGALECLGYPSNKKGFRQLGSRLRWETVAAAARAGVDMHALFMWAAGFGPKPADAPAAGGKAPEWRARHGRPANSPKARLAAAVAWAVRWANTGGPAQVFTNAVAGTARPSGLLPLFSVRAAGHGVAPLGATRARDIVVNHLLPSVHAIATAGGQARLAARAKRLFDEHGLLQPNSITREASRLLRARGAAHVPGTAREQQGLIHIYRMATARQHPERQLPLL